MTTVATRTFRSSPERSAHETWVTIVTLLTGGASGDCEAQLLAVSGIAASVISERTPKAAPIVVTCDGPRTRIYCLYDEDAVDGADANEAALGFNPLNGDWRVSLPCAPDDLSWMQAALKKHGDRVTARDPLASAASATSDSPKPEALAINPKGFLG